MQIHSEIMLLKDYSQKIKWILTFLKKNIITIIFFIIINYIYRYHVHTQPLVGLLNSALLILLYVLLAKSKYTCWIIYLVTFLFFFDIFFLYQYAGFPSLGIITSILDTSFSEVLSMFKNYSVIIIVFLVIYVIVSHFLIKELRNNKINIYWLLAAIICICIAYRIVFDGEYNHIKEMLKSEKTREDINLEIYNKVCTYTPLIYQDIYSVIIHYQEKKRLSDYSLSPKILPNGIFLNLDKEKHLPQNIVVILGESSNRNYLSLYGYNITTTPFLDNLSSTDTLYKYTAISPASITIDAIKLSFTFAIPNNLDAFFENKTIINLANDAGYETIWLSNQDNMGTSDSYIACIAENATKKYFSSTISVNDDFVLLSKLENILESDKNQFIVLHLQGSHASYTDRYDEKDLLIMHEDKTIEDYIRTIHHTDRFIGEVYNIIKKDNIPSCIFYYSDHGECIGEGHGQINRSKDQFEIPFVLIPYKMSFPVDSIANKYVDKESGLINSISTINILAEIMGYTVSDTLVNKTLEESKYIYFSGHKPFIYLDYYNLR